MNPDLTHAVFMLAGGVTGTALACAAIRTFVRIKSASNLHDDRRANLREFDLSLSARGLGCANCKPGIDWTHNARCRVCRGEELHAAVNVFVEKALGGSRDQDPDAVADAYTALNAEADRLDQDAILFGAEPTFANLLYAAGARPTRTRNTGCWMCVPDVLWPDECMCVRCLRQFVHGDDQVPLIPADPADPDQAQA